ncbi:acyl-CoA N-acyltransferase [Piedraia hortae CBS 480.64]|uniref:Acyl-CoA N-acyltransferase n=1 Tax=Piedraia hortae CBS 480.64 TaxID=1314780 RepID=A0A6A7C6Z8_9PEZI|nr:acyl-CoA N-acyltransferase [Piedraia hortae CBS 480.64]
MPYVYDDGSDGSTGAGFTIATAKADDAARLVSIEFSAFRHETANQQLSFRDAHDASHVARAVEAYTACLAISTPVTRFLKVIDQESGNIVSFAKFEFKTYSDAELASPADVGHERDPPMNRDWFALNERLRRDYVGGKTHCYIAMLATEPEHQCRGAGRLLLNQILELADAKSLMTYLEATDTARPLYAKHGFVRVRDIEFDAGEYGVPGLRERQTIMVRQPGAGVL